MGRQGLKSLLSPAARNLSRVNLLAFIKATFPSYEVGWFHREICACLQKFIADVADRKSPRLILTIPPRHGKSQIVSREFPPWTFGIFPDWEIISASYGADLAIKMGRDVQNIMESDEYAEIFPNVRLKDARIFGSEKTKIAFEIPGHRGAYKGAGVDGGITGRGAHILIIDDPFKNRKDADSPTIRQNVWDWYTSTAYTRLAPGGGILITHTRWHEDDLVGRLLRKEKENGGAENWKVINFPAIAEHDEKHRKKGEALHPQRYPLDALERIKNTLGSYDFNALYQQRPTARGGGIFKRSWIRYYKTRPQYFDKVIQSWDFTFKGGDGSDNVAGSVWGKVGGNYYLLDLVWEKLDFVGQIRAMLRLTNKWPEAYGKVVEDKANGPAVISALSRKVPGIIGYTPREGKEGRAYAVSPLFEAGNVFIPEQSPENPWVNDYVDELTSFPNAPHDDAVDSTTQALLHFMKEGGRGIVDFL